MSEKPFSRTGRACAFLLGVLLLAGTVFALGSALFSGAGRTTVVLYFSNLNRTGLVAVERDIPGAANQRLSAEQLVKELVYGPVDNSVLPVLPARLKVHSVWLSKNTAYVDFDRQFMLDVVGDTIAGAEQLTIFSLVNTLVKNLDGIEKVQILVEGVPVKTLRGLTRIEKPLFPREHLIQKKK